MLRINQAFIFPVALFLFGCPTGDKQEPADSPKSPAPPAGATGAAGGTAAMTDDPDVEDDLESTPAGGRPPTPNPPANPADPGSPVGPNKYLPMRIETMNNRQLYAYLRGLIYDKHPRNTQGANRRCVVGVDGCTANSRTYVWLQPHMVMKNVDPASIPNEGLVVGRIWNNGRYREGRYNLPRGKIYWLVDRDPADTTRLRSRFFQRTFDADAPIEFVGDASKDFYKCTNHVDPGGTVAKAKWTTCPAALVNMSEAEKKKKWTDHEPAWLTCAQGCCIAGRALDGGP